MLGELGGHGCTVVIRALSEQRADDEHDCEIAVGATRVRIRRDYVPWRARALSSREGPRRGFSSSISPAAPLRRRKASRSDGAGRRRYTDASAARCGFVDRFGRGPPPLSNSICLGRARLVASATPPLAAVVANACAFRPEVGAGRGAKEHALCSHPARVTSPV